MGKLEDEILSLLKESEPLTLMEIAEKLNKAPKAVFRSLRKLFEEGKIGCDIRTKRYYLEKNYEKQEEEEATDVDDL
ncbi:MAG: ArsR family transcriptional regulator [Candidatus Bathyarchaeia archaeon]